MGTLNLHNDLYTKRNKIGRLNDKIEREVKVPSDLANWMLLQLHLPESFSLNDMVLQYHLLSNAYGFFSKPSKNLKFHSGSIGYHLRPGKHAFTFYDWLHYLDYADLHLKKK